MPFTLEQLDFLSLRVGVAIPPAFLENKRRAEEFKKRSAGIGARAEEMKQRRDGAALAGWFQQAGAAAGGRDFAAALKLLDQVEAGLAAPEPDDGPFQEKWKVAKETWRQCLEVVDAQIAQARSRMQGSDDPDFKIIAELGLPALTGNHKTPVMAAVLELDGGQSPARKAAAAKAVAAIAAFRQHLDSYHLIAALDQHGQTALGVPLTIRREIGKGLAALEEAVQLAVAD